MNTDRLHRQAELAAFYTAHRGALERILRRRVRTSEAVIEDACQTAWTILCAHPDVAVHEHTTLGWLITTATREAWKQSRHLAERETPAGAFQPPGDNADHELAEPVGSAPDPCAVVVARDEASQRLAILTDRERVYLALQGHGYDYTEMAHMTSATLRTVERQVLRARSKLAATDG
jgi:DNA-directed RNA polymerase specialized sigma24 family protein